MEVVKIIITVLEVIASVVLILVVMFQSGKEAGLSSALTGNADNYMSKSKFGSLDKVLASATKWIVLAWALLVLCLHFFPKG